MIRVLALCESLTRAVRFSHAVGGVEGVHYEALVCNNGRRSGVHFWLRLLVELFRAGPDPLREALRLWRAGRLHVRRAPLGDERTLAWLRDRSYDVGLHSMGVIYRRSMIDVFRLGILNPHIGMLPDYRGRSVMEWSLLEGQPTGITVFFIDEGIDTGSPIVLRQEVDLRGFATLQEAKQHLFSLDGQMFAAALRRLQSPEFLGERQFVEQGRRYYVMSTLLQEVATARLKAA